MKVKWMLLAAALMSTAALAAPVTQFSKQVPVKPGDRVSLSNISGSVTITTWDKHEVDVQGELEADVERVDVLQEAGNIDIKVVVRKNHWNDSDARLQIRLPADVQLDASTVSASIAVSGVRDNVRLKSVSGDIRSDIAGADLEAKSVSGDIELTGTSTWARVRTSSVSGDVDLVRATGDVEARSTSGDLDIQMQGMGNVRAQAVSGDIVLRGAMAGDADVELQSVSGRVKVAAQIPNGFRYNVSSFSGSIRNCFGYEVQRSDDYSGSRMDGVRGEGKGRLSVKSHSGSVELCDR